MKTLRFRVVELPTYIRCGADTSYEADGIFPRHIIWKDSFGGGGNTTITNNSGLPLKVKLFKNSILVAESDYFGDPIHQNDLDNFNTNNYLPIQTINNVMVFNYLLTGILTSTIVDIKVYSPLMGGAFNLNIDC